MATKSTYTQKIKELKHLYNNIEIVLTRDDAEPSVYKGKSIKGFKISNNQVLTNLDSTGKASENVLDLKPDTGSGNGPKLDMDRENERKIHLHRKYDERVRLAISIWETYPDCSKPPMSNPSPKIGLHELKAWAWQELKKAKVSETQPQKNDGQVKMDMPDYRDFTKVPVLKLIEYGEGHTLEFKETLEYDMRQNQHNKNLNKECLKTIAAFLNTDGGILLIGVKDNGKVTGIEQDLRYVQRKNLDGFELKLRNLIRDRFDLTPLNKVRIKFEKLETGTICRVNVDPVNRPQVVHLDKEVYLRDGNTTTKLDGMDLTNWTQQRVQN